MSKFRLAKTHFLHAKSTLVSSTNSKINHHLIQTKNILFNNKK